jgi:hypothetical protein
MNYLQVRIPGISDISKEELPVIFEKDYAPVRLVRSLKSNANQEKQDDSIPGFHYSCIQ